MTTEAVINRTASVLYQTAERVNNPTFEDFARALAGHGLLVEAVPS